MYIRHRGRNIPVSYGIDRHNNLHIIVGNTVIINSNRKTVEEIKRARGDRKDMKVFYLLRTKYRNVLDKEARRKIS